MFYSPEVGSEKVILQYKTINPRLANVLNETPLNSFTPIVPDQQGFMSFFVQEKNGMITQPLESVRAQIANAVMGEKRQQVLNDYFARLRLNADIQIVRLPEQ